MAIRMLVNLFPVFVVNSLQDEEHISVKTLIVYAKQSKKETVQFAVIPFSLVNNKFFVHMF